MAQNYLKIREVMDADPGTFGALTDALAADEFNVENKSHNLSSMTGKQVKDLMDDVEYVALGVDSKNIILALTGRDDLDPFGIDRTIFLDAMPILANPNTAVNLNAGRTITTSTAFINKLTPPVLEVHVMRARALG